MRFIGALVLVFFPSWPLTEPPPHNPTIIEYCGDRYIRAFRPCFEIDRYEEI